MYSCWEYIIRDPQLSPFREISVGERHVDYSDEKLCDLKEKLGDEVVKKKVVRALEEVEEFIHVVDIHLEPRGRKMKARLNEIIFDLNQLVKESFGQQNIRR
ncbi:hypothetical protein R1flu_018636 [Riccia fluitans]|uniref:Factor of DNA methylation 1-5/IDN2 domain-containing protein n=1 Tax=Riccia fluitans TaxID=41844 RepID=A0ABD1ZGK9_9MARC